MKTVFHFLFLVVMLQSLSAQNVERGDALPIFGQALHTDPTTGPFLGATRGDRESSVGTTTDMIANWDDTNNSNDEDAFSNNYTLLSGNAYTVFLPNIDGTAATYSISCAVGGGVNSPVRAWIDFDGDGQFEATEKTSATSAAGTVTLIWTLPLNLQPQLTYARIRVTSLANVANIENPTGTAANGEVEDYVVRVVRIFPVFPQPRDTVNLPSLNGVSGAAATINAVNTLPIAGGVICTMSLSGTAPNQIGINDNHIAGSIGVRTGHNNGVALTQATAIRTSYSFSALMPDLSFKLVDIDVGDHLKVEVFNNGVPVSYNYNTLTANYYYAYDSVNKIIHCDNGADGGVSSISPSSADMGVQILCQSYVDSIAITYWDLSGSGTYTIFDISFAEFVVLPLNLKSFFAQYKSNDHIDLLWETGQDEDVEKYIIEKSFDGNSFHAIADIKSHKTFNTSLYNYSDNTPNSNNIAYYRLRIEKSGGKLSYSKTISVKVNAGDRGRLNILDVSFINGGNAVIESATRLSGNLFMFNSNGLPVVQQKIILQPGRNNINIGLHSQWPAGVYILQLNMGNNIVLNRKVVKL